MEFVKTIGDMVHKLIKETGMKKEDSDESRFTGFMRSVVDSVGPKG